jgi:hypothetical protein
MLPPHPGEVEAHGRRHVRTNDRHEIRTFAESVDGPVCWGNLELWSASGLLCQQVVGQFGRPRQCDQVAPGKDLQFEP